MKILFITKLISIIFRFGRLEKTENDKLHEIEENKRNNKLLKENKLFSDSELETLDEKQQRLISEGRFSELRVEMTKKQIQVANARKWDK